MLLAASAVVGARATAESTIAVGAAALLLLAPLFAEPLVRRVAAAPFEVPRLRVAISPAARVGDGPVIPVVHTGLILAVAGTGWLGFAGWPAGVVLAAGLAAPALQAWVLVDRWRRRAGPSAELAGLEQAVAGYGPRFLIYFSAQPGSEYQLAMWVPQLERLGAPFLVVLGERENLAAVGPLTTAPVVAISDSAVLETILVPSVRAVFYVNNAMKNTHCVRYSGVTHVQLYHGDSDKAVTTSPVNAIYDRVFVAGRAAIDRFTERGVDIPSGKFRIVGRPQVAPLAVGRGPSERPAVLYAPTWVGAYGEPNHCSLPVAETMVQALLDRGVTVIMRPHPYTSQHPASMARLRRIEHMLAVDRQRSGLDHRFGDATSRSLYECMDSSDAMVCDVSAVASDYLYTGKPFAITDMARGDRDLTTTMPLARAAYVLDRDLSNLGEVLNGLLGDDPLKPRRADLREYYLGGFPPDRYADAFLDEARRCLAEPAMALSTEVGGVDR